MRIKGHRNKGFPLHFSSKRIPRSLRNDSLVQRHRFERYSSPTITFTKLRRISNKIDFHLLLENGWKHWKNIKRLKLNITVNFDDFLLCCFLGSKIYSIIGEKSTDKERVQEKRSRTWRKRNGERTAVIYFKLCFPLSGGRVQSLRAERAWVEAFRGRKRAANIARRSKSAELERSNFMSLSRQWPQRRPSDAKRLMSR